MKRNLKQILYKTPVFLLAVLILVGCSEKKKIQSELEVMYQHPIDLSLEKMDCKHSAVDTIDSEVNGKWKFTFVQYVDSTQCSPCTLNKMFKWNECINRLHKKGVRFVFIFEPNKPLLEDVYLAVESSGLKNPVYVDTAYVFRRDNEFVPKGIRYHSFLLDKEGNVLVVGNPLLNKKIEKLINTTINH